MITNIKTGEHPVEMNIYRLPTVAMENMLNAVFGWIDKLTPGAIVYGKPRSGKTESIFEIVERLESLFGKYIPVDIFDCAHYAGSTANENRFYQELLEKFGYALKPKINVAINYSRLITYMIQQVREANDFRFILFLDEAQCLHENHYKWLMGIHNKLKLEGVRLIVFLVGQPELIARRHDFATSSRKQIVGRFMVGAHEFFGIRNENEMKTFLKGYDTAVYPENSSCSYTNYFLPNAYKHGFRIQDYNNEFIKSFKMKLSEETSINSRYFEIPMESLPLAVGYILQTLSQYDSQSTELNEDLINEAIDYSDYIGWMRNVVEHNEH